MEQSSSELSSPASELLRAHKLLLKDNVPAEATIKEVTRICAKVIHDLNSSPPPQPMRAVVDNDNPTPESMGIDPNIPNDVHDSNVDESGCSASTVIDAPLQANLPRWPVLPLMVSPTAINTLNRSALVIEHDRSLSRMFAAYLKYDGYVVRTAYESEDALRLYRDCAPFDLVLIDHGMPRKSGIDIAIGILKQDATQPMIITALEYRTEDDVPRPNELRHIPLLLDMNNGRLRKFIQKYQRWATREEVDRASAALTSAELLKLQKFGDGRVCFAQGTDHRTGEDLLQEALRLTFEGADDGESGRHWNKRVSFEKYLAGVIRSISGRRKGDGALLECDTIKRDAEGQEWSPLDNAASSETAADQRLIVEEGFNHILGKFNDDPEAVLLLQSWSEGMKRNEIIQEHKFSENQYRAAVKRIRMKLLSRRNGGRGDEDHDGQD